MKALEPRPWTLQFQWKSQVEYEKHSYRARNRLFKQEWENWTRKFRDPAHAQEQLNKDLNDSTYDFFVGRNWRIFNKQTQEALYVIIEGKTITII